MGIGCDGSGVPAGGSLTTGAGWVGLAEAAGSIGISIGEG